MESWVFIDKIQKMPCLPKSFEEIFNCTIAQFRILQCDKFF